MKQHNMGKVYSGLYEVAGHIVPFLVLVKVGKPSEVSKPGNRGKRDSPDACHALPQPGTLQLPYDTAGAGNAPSDPQHHWRESYVL